MQEEARNKVIARLLHMNGAYWLFHKNYVDDTIE